MNPDIKIRAYSEVEPDLSMTSHINKLKANKVVYVEGYGDALINLSAERIKPKSISLEREPFVINLNGDNTEGYLVGYENSEHHTGLVIDGKDVWFDSFDVEEVKTVNGVSKEDFHKYLDENYQPILEACIEETSKQGNIFMPLGDSRKGIEVQSNNSKYVLNKTHNSRLSVEKDEEYDYQNMQYLSHQANGKLLSSAKADLLIKGSFIDSNGKHIDGNLRMTVNRTETFDMDYRDLDISPSISMPSSDRVLPATIREGFNDENKEVSHKATSIIFEKDGGEKIVIHNELNNLEEIEELLGEGVARKVDSRMSVYMKDEGYLSIKSGDEYKITEYERADAYSYANVSPSQLVEAERLALHKAETTKIELETTGLNSVDFGKTPQNEDRFRTKLWIKDVERDLSMQVEVSGSYEKSFDADQLSEEDNEDNIVTTIPTVRNFDIDTMKVEQVLQKIPNQDDVDYIQLKNPESYMNRAVFKSTKAELSSEMRDLLNPHLKKDRWVDFHYVYNKDLTLSKYDDTRKQAMKEPPEPTEAQLKVLEDIANARNVVFGMESDRPVDIVAKSRLLTGIFEPQRNDLSTQLGNIVKQGYSYANLKAPHKPLSLEEKKPFVSPSDKSIVAYSDRFSPEYKELKSLLNYELNDPSPSSARTISDKLVKNISKNIDLEHTDPSFAYNFNVKANEQMVKLVDEKLAEINAKKAVMPNAIEANEQEDIQTYRNETEFLNQMDIFAERQARDTVVKKVMPVSEAKTDPKWDFDFDKKLEQAREKSQSLLNEEVITATSKEPENSKENEQTMSNEQKDENTYRPRF